MWSRLVLDIITHYLSDRRLFLRKIQVFSASIRHLRAFLRYGGRCACRLVHGLGMVLELELRFSSQLRLGMAFLHHKELASRLCKALVFPQSGV